MVAPDSHRQRVGWHWSISVTILGVLILWGSAWLQSSEAGKAPPHHLESQRHIAVRQGQLSVQLQQAELLEVLSEIGRQAGIVITGSLRSEPRLSAQFTAVPLESGLRRLLRIASLSSAMVYGPGSGGSIALREVRVFETGGETAAPLQTIARGSHAADAGETSLPFSAALAEISQTWAAPMEAGESDITSRFRAALETVQSDNLPPSEENGLALSFRMALEGAQLPASTPQ
jgi:hypothetical protein